MPLSGLGALPAQGEIVAVGAPARFVHGFGPDLLSIAVGLHAGAALEHHVIDHDRTVDRRLGRGT